MGDRASDFVFTYPLRNNTAERVVKQFLNLLLTVGTYLLLCIEQGKEFTDEEMTHLLKWLYMAIDYGPTDHPRVQSTVERPVGRAQETANLLPNMGRRCTANGLTIPNNT